MTSVKKYLNRDITLLDIKRKKNCTGKREFECDQCKKYLYQRIRTGVKEFKYDQC